MTGLSATQTDALTEAINIGVGRAAEALNDIVGRHVVLSVPRVEVLDLAGTDAESLMRCLGVGAMQDPVSVVQEFSGTPRGKVALAFSHDTAACLASALTGERLDSPELDSVKVGTLVEVGNIVINGFVGSIANLFDGDVVFGLPEFHDHGLSGLVGGNEGADAPGVVVVAETRFHIEHLDLGGYLFLVLEMRNIGHLLVELEPRRGGA